MKLADRTTRIASSPTMKVTATVDRLRRSGVEVIDFGAGEPDFPTPDPVKAAAHAALAGLHADSFDIMIFDPPYDERADDLLAAAGEHLSAGGVLVLEHARRVGTPERAGRLRKSREVISGDSALGFYANS